MAAQTYNQVVSYGSSYAGRTVTYKILSSAGVPVTQGVSGTVFEIGGGDYGVAVTVPDTQDYFIQWTLSDGGKLLTASNAINSGEASAAPAQPLVPLSRALGSFSTSGAMMRSEMVTRAKAILGEVEGTEGADSPFEWNSLLSQAADDLSRGTYCFYTAFTLPLVSGQADYCVPPLFRLAGAFLRNPATGDVLQLVEATKRDLDAGWPQLYGGPWYGGFVTNFRQGISAGKPAVYLWGALSGLTLYPPPDAATTAAYNLITEGWATTEGQWDLDTDVCPLPPRLHPTVIDGAVLLRAAQYPGTANLALIKARYDAARGKAEREASTFARRQIGGW